MVGGIGLDDPACRRPDVSAVEDVVQAVFPFYVLVSPMPCCVRYGVWSRCCETIDKAATCKECRYGQVRWTVEVADKNGRKDFGQIVMDVLDFTGANDLGSKEQFQRINGAFIPTGNSRLQVDIGDLDLFSRQFYPEQDRSEVAVLPRQVTHVLQRRFGQDAESAGPATVAEIHMTIFTTECPTKVCFGFPVGFLKADKVGVGLANRRCDFLEIRISIIDVVSGDCKLSRRRIDRF